MERGKIPLSDILIVDRNRNNRAYSLFSGKENVSFEFSDWADYLISYFSGYRGNGDRLVPAHIAPHLLLRLVRDTVERKTGMDTETVPVKGSFNLPFERGGEGGILYISAAAWLCPFSCIEPEICPATRGERHWDISSTVRENVSADRVIVFKTTHYAWSVGTISADYIREQMLSLCLYIQNSGRRNVQVVVATTSNCHGVVGAFNAVRR